MFLHPAHGFAIGHYAANQDHRAIFPGVNVTDWPAASVVSPVEAYPMVPERWRVQLKFTLKQFIDKEPAVRDLRGLPEYIQLWKFTGRIR